MINTIQINKFNGLLFFIDILKISLHTQQIYLNNECILAKNIRIILLDHGCKQQIKKTSK